MKTEFNCVIFARPLGDDTKRCYLGYDKLSKEFYAYTKTTSGGLWTISFSLKLNAKPTPEVMEEILQKNRCWMSYQTPKLRDFSRKLWQQAQEREKEQFSLNN